MEAPVSEHTVADPSNVLYQVQDRVARVTINRPAKRNALDFSTLHALQDALERARVDDAVRVVVVTGAGDRAFCAGGDLAGMKAGGFLEQHEGRRQFARVFQKLQEIGKPTIARVNGVAYGGGFGVALACDMIVAQQSARFATPEIKVGLYPFMVMAVLFRNIPRKIGLELCFSGRPVAASEAKEIGFVNRVVPDAELDAAVDELAASISCHSPAILKLGKDAFYAMADMPYERALDYLHTMFSINTLTDDAAEGITAFIQKRAPEWKGT